jgi:glycosyltransferase involved in cell wall biosynthesis
VNYLVSIAIPTVDRLDYLKEAVASALAQTYEEIEILIGDDGTTAEIEKWGRSISRIDLRIRYQRRERHLGMAGNWNALVDAARGEFVIIIGDDDRLLPDFVQRLTEIIPPSAEVAFANHYLIDREGVRLETESRQLTSHYHRDKLPAGEILNPAISVWRNSIPMSAAMVRTAVVRRLRFKEDLNTPEIEFFARLAQEGAHFFFTPEYLAEYRVHGNSATGSGLRGEALVKYLAPITVAADVEPYKREFMETLLVNTVTRCLRQGNRPLARQFLNHEYYPRLNFTRKTLGPDRRVDGQIGVRRNKAPFRRILKDALTCYVQNLCIRLPASVGYPTYRLLQTTKSRLLRHS